MYQIPELISRGIDFNAVYAEKQGIVRTATGMDFGLGQIVELIKAETNNFSKSNKVAQDIDTAVYDLTKKWLKSTGQDAEPAEEPESEEVVKIRAEMADLKELMEISDGDDLKKLEQGYQDLEELLTMLTE